MALLCKRMILTGITSSAFKIFQCTYIKHTFDGADINDDDELCIGKFGSYTVFRINRPEKRNCLNYSTAVKLKEGLAKFNNDILSSVAIIHGEGGSFCSGLDCSELANDKNFYEKFLALGLMEEFSKKPVIAAVSGYAVGTGFDLALWCDLRVVEDTAIFGYYNRRLGVPSPESAIKRLIGLVGRARAVDWVLTGRTVHAKEAFQTGIVSRLVACGTAYGQSVSLAKAVEKFPFPSTLWVKLSLYMDSISEEEQQKVLKERENLILPIANKIATNAKAFVDGFGRHGKSTHLK
ncbi:putative enoyl-CoA hydratase isoform X2 [Lycorma delicatula]